MEQQQTCSLDDIRFDAVVYSSSRVNKDGEPDGDELARGFDIAAWQPAKEPYYCSSCDWYFPEWEAVKAHMTVK